MQNFDLQNLLEKYRKNTCTDEELRLLDNWYLQWKIDPYSFDAEELTEVKNEVWTNLAQEIRRKEAIKLWPRITVIAAAVATMIISVYFMINHYSTVQEPQTIVYGNDIAPGKNQAVLMLANGKKIILSDAKTGIVIDGRKLTYSDGTEIDPDLQKAGTHSAYEMQTISTPCGGTYQILLPDGSKVWLNAASTLKYPLSFPASLRKVELVGEAYFEISKNKEKPFVVRSANQDVTVLGTKFNIESYSNEVAVKTTLAEGSVKVTRNTSGSPKRDFYLKPGQQSQLTDKDVQVKNVDVSSVVAWTKGDFVFVEEGLTSIMRKLARWYDVDVEYRNAPMHLRFDAVISRSNNLSGILDIIQNTGKVKFIIKSRKIIVTQ